MLTVLDHSLIKHKLSIMRNKDTSTYIFKQNLDEIAKLMAYEVTKDIPVRVISIETPICQTVGYEIDHPLVLVPILRAGIGLVDGFRDIIPTAKIGHIGMYRNEETLEPIEYYARFPKCMPDSIVIVTDPMLATGGSAIAESIRDIGGRLFHERPCHISARRETSQPTGLPLLKHDRQFLQLAHAVVGMAAIHDPWPVHDTMPRPAVLPGKFRLCETFRPKSSVLHHVNPNAAPLFDFPPPRLDNLPPVSLRELVGQLNETSPHLLRQRHRVLRSRRPLHQPLLQHIERTSLVTLPFEYLR